MPFFQESAVLQDVAATLLDRLGKNPKVVSDFGRTGLLIHIHLTNPQAFIGLNGRSKPASFSYTLDGAKPDLELSLEADTLHAIWLGERRLRDAYFGGEIKTRGSIFKVLQLAPIFREAETQYRIVLRDKGLI